MSGLDESESWENVRRREYEQAKADHLQIELLLASLRPADTLRRLLSYTTIRRWHLHRWHK